MRSAKALQQNPELLQIRCKRRRRRPTLPLVQFRRRLDAMRPRDRNPQSRPLHKRASEESAGWFDALFAQGNSKGIAQMTNHLMRGHGSPSSPGVGRNPGKPFEHLIPVARMLQGFHWKQIITLLCRRRLPQEIPPVERLVRRYPGPVQQCPSDAPDAFSQGHEKPMTPIKHPLSPSLPRCAATGSGHYQSPA